MFVTNWISTTKIQKISEITNFFRHYFLSRTEVVLCAKQEIRQTQETARREKAEASTSSTGMMFVPMEPPTIDLPMEDLLYGINITFPNGTLVSVKKGCAKSVMALMKLYEKEDAVCLD